MRNFKDYLKLPLLTLFAGPLLFAIFNPATSYAYLDVVFANYSNVNTTQDNNRFCLNNGDQTFNCENVANDLYGANGVDVGDVNNDGYVDIVTANQLGNRHNQVCLNDGVGGFICTDVGEPRFSLEPALGDLNHDGNQDIVFANSTQFGQVCLGNGSGTFTCEDFGSAVLNSVAVQLGDMDKDGNLDAVFPQQYGANLVCYGDGIGGLSCLEIDGSEQYYSEDVTLAYFDNNETLDVVFTTLNGNQAVERQICLNNGDRSFNCSGFGKNINYHESGVAAGDFNQDGKEDVVFSNGFSGPSRICYGNGDGQFECVAKLNVGSVNKVEVGDMDGNGNQDVVFSGPYANKICYNFDDAFICKNVESDISLTTNLALGDLNNSFSPQNKPPTLTPLTPQTTTEGTPLTFTLSATDPDGDTLTYTATNLPQGATLDATTGAFSWTPDFTDAGEYQVTFTATEDTPEALSASTTVTITVINFNRAPELAPIGNQMVNEGDTLEFTISATDADGGAITYSATNLPAGATFTPSTGVFSWNTDFDDAGNYDNIEFTATDNGSPMQLDVELITVTVGNVNRAPQITNPGPQTVLEADTVSFTVSATDPDNDTVTLTATNLPAGATFNATTGTFSWTTTLADAGVYIVTITATDNGTPTEAVSTDVVITVGDNPTPTEQAEDLVETVIIIDVPQNVENSYLANLRKVEQFIQEGKVTAAINQLDAFINKITQDYQQGILTQTEYEMLRGMAENLINDLES